MMTDHPPEFYSGMWWVAGLIVTQFFALASMYVKYRIDQGQAQVERRANNVATQAVSVQLNEVDRKINGHLAESKRLAHQQGMADQIELSKADISHLNDQLAQLIQSYEASLKLLSPSQRALVELERANRPQQDIQPNSPEDPA